MGKHIRYRNLVPVYLLVLACFLIVAFGGNRVVTVMSENTPVTYKRTVVIDAGHGGVDGGATSCTGALESNINLEIALKLNDLMHLLGINTVMIRETDCSVYTEGESIAQKKVSDLRERVRIVNSIDNALLVSIHQNQFSDGRYKGAQVFYAPTADSKELAQSLQSALIRTVNPDSHRQIKKADKIYIMQHIKCTGILVECGFVSNHDEAYLLSDANYQRKLCSVIACSVSDYLFRA